MRVSRQNMIISHGGRHGASRTLRKGQAVTRADAEAIPGPLTRQLTGTRPEKHTGDKTDREGVKPNVSKKKRADDAKKAAGPAVPGSKVITNADHKDQDAPPEPESTTPLPPAPSEPEPEPKAESDEPSDPEKKRDLILMKKAEVEKLAAKHGIEVDAGTPGRTDLLRDLIAQHLGL